MRTTVIGAHPKISDDPAGQELRRALHEHDRGEIDEAALEAVCDAVTVRALGELEAAGIDVVNTGLVRWDDLFSPFARAWRNVRLEALERYFDNNTYFRIPAVGGPISVARAATVAEFRFARGHATRPVKGTLCGPLTFARLASDRHYRDRRALALAVAGALREEILVLEREGCELLDVEEPALARWPEDAAYAEEVYREIGRGVRARLAVHLTMFPADGVLEIAARLPVAVVGIDLRSRPTRALDRIDVLPGEVVLGIVDARNTRLETADDLARAIDRAAARVGPERLWLAPTTALEYLPHDVALQKLRVLVAASRSFLAAGGAR